MINGASVGVWEGGSREVSRGFCSGRFATQSHADIYNDDNNNDNNSSSNDNSNDNDNYCYIVFSTAGGRLQGPAEEAAQRPNNDV